MKKRPSGKYHDLIRQGNHTALLSMLTSPQPVDDLNEEDSEGCSLLYLALSMGYGKFQPGIITKLLLRGAIIKNGTPGNPQIVPKLLTRHANSKNAAYILKKILEYHNGFKPEDLLLEIGSGDGYLKYLLDLCEDGEIHRLAGKIMETEPSPEVVRNNISRGRYLLQSGVEELENFFPQDFFSAIISLNVLDLFPPKELDEKLTSLYHFVKPGGYIVHIMSSSVHQAVFKNILDTHPDFIMLPYYQEGFPGVRLVNMSLIQNRIQQASLVIKPEQLAELFARQPEKYIQIADEISGNFAGLKDQGRILLLKDFSLQQILAGLKQTGYKPLACEEITSTSIALRDQYHGLFPGYNQFSSIAGSLLTDVSEQTADGQVLEKSVFYYIIAEKI